MKKTILVIMLLPLMAFASANITFSTLRVEQGSNFTVYVNVKNAAAWNLEVKGTGATSGCYQKYAGDSGTGKNVNKSFSLSCKATNIGRINISLTGDVTYANMNNSSVNQNRSLNSVKARVRSADNNLSSLGVKGFSLSPSFSKDKLNYTVTVTPDVEEIEIIGNKSSSYARVSGLGKHSIVDNKQFSIQVTSETGNTKTYKLNVLIEDKNPLIVKYNAKEYTVNKQKNLLPELKHFKILEKEIEKEKIPVLYNEKIKYIIALLTDDKGETVLARYKDEKFESFEYLEFDKLFLVLTELDKELLPFQKMNINYNDKKLDVFKLKEEHDYFLLKGINLENNKEDYYYIHAKDNTIQKFDIDLIQEKADNKKDNNVSLPYITIIVVLLVFIITQFILLKKKNNLS